MFYFLTISRTIITINTGGNMDTNNQDTAKPSLSAVPTTWPGAFGAYKHSKQAVMLNVQSLLLLFLVYLILGGSINGIFNDTSSANLVSFVFGGLLMSALIIVYLAGVRKQKVEVGKALSDAVHFWLKMLGLEIVVGFCLFVSLLLFIIPFFIVMPRLILANYFLIDKDMGIMDAVKASWGTTKGHSGKVWGVIGATFAMALLMITIVGIPFSIYFLFMYSAAFAVLYAHLIRAPKA